MEKVCEFCTARRPAVYCQADCALLCLACDSRVHSANALSNRHIRSILCDSCRARPALARCYDHGMYTCRSCDSSLHNHSGSLQQHRKRAISSYIGCPSAKDFAALWDLDLSASALAAVSASREFVDFEGSGFGSSVGSVMSCTSSVRAAIPNSRTKNQRSNKISQKGQQQQQQQQNQSSRFIVQQILDLNRLQLDEGNNRLYSRTLPGEEAEENISSAFEKALRRKDTNENLHRDRDIESEFLDSVAPLDELKSDGFSSEFSSLENFLSSASGVSLLGDSFWQCRSPLQTSQFMPQNIQDIGLCEDLVCRDDFNNIPDVDATFRSFEELFGREQDPTRGTLVTDNDPSCSSLDQEISLDKFEDSHAPSIEDAFASSSEYLESHLDRVTHPLQPSYSALSTFSSSQETEGASNSEGAAKEDAVTRYQDKKKARVDGKKTRHGLLLKDRTSAAGKRAKGRSG